MTVNLNFTTVIYPRTLLLVIFGTFFLSENLPASPNVLEASKITGNVFAFIGSGGRTEIKSKGHVANSGFIIEKDGVIVIDTGVSHNHGKRMIEQIESITDLPIKLVVITHANQDFVFGITAFKERGIPIIAHKKTIDLMDTRCETCLDNLIPILGAELEGTSVALPNIVWNNSNEFKIKNSNVEIMYFGWTNTKGSLAVLDKTSRTLFSGSLVTVRHVPYTPDGNFEGWLNALKDLSNSPIEKLVPGYGPISTVAEGVSLTTSYLTDLHSKISAMYERNDSLLETLEDSSMPEYSTWQSYKFNHGKNVQHKFLELEIIDLENTSRQTQKN